MQSIQGTIYISGNQINAIIEDYDGIRLIKDGKEIADYPQSCAFPGFIDSHCHIWGIGMLMNDPNLTGLKSLDDCLELVSRRVPNRGEWIYGRGWNEQLWSKKEFPNKAMLDELFPNTPVFLFRVDGHAAWVNSTALQLAGITSSTPSPIGGEIVKNQSGEPTGILIDNAFNIVESLIPYYSDAYLEKMILDACNDCLSKGITEVDDMDVPLVQIPTYIRLASENKLPIRINSFLSAQTEEYISQNLRPSKGNFFSIVGAKFFMDGALGSRGASLLEPYSDAVNTTGLLFIDENEIYNKVKNAVMLDFDIAIHAIGDRANRIALNALAKIRNENKSYRGKLRIEHCQIIHPDDIKIFADNNIIASVQAIHYDSDILMAQQRLGQKRFEERGYLWQSFLDNRAHLISGSDAPIESNNPFLGINAFIHRNNVITDEPSLQRLSLENALSSYISTPRMLKGFDSSNKLESNSIADITILDNFPENPEVKATIVNGEIKYSK